MLKFILEEKNKDFTLYTEIVYNVYEDNAKLFTHIKDFCKQQGLKLNLENVIVGILGKPENPIKTIHVGDNLLVTVKKIGITYKLFHN